MIRCRMCQVCNHRTSAFVLDVSCFFLKLTQFQLLHFIMLRSVIHKIHTTYLPYCWIFIFPAAALLSLELTFEKTYLTWVYGSQMIGYAFSYLFPPVIIICILSVYLCYVWLGLVGVIAILTRSLPAKPELIRIALTVAVLVLERVPITVWQGILSLLLGQPDHDGFIYGPY